MAWSGPPRADSAAYSDRLRLPGPRPIVAALVPILLLTAVVLIRATTPTPVVRTAAELAGGAAALTPVALKAAAADALDTALVAGGAGYTFEIVQHAILVARPGGPRIQVPDPINFHKVGQVVDRYEVNSLIERGAVTPAGFWMEMRAGPLEGAKPDWTSSYRYGALVRDGITYRNDGEGWYETTQPPGIGLDPVTAALLPTMLRKASGARVATELIPGAAKALTATTSVTDLPGIVAVDGAPFTTLDGPAELAFDASGRLIGLHVLARNTNVTEFDLLIDTSITFGYPDQAGPLPVPEPAYTRTTPVTTP